jgi:hypothetical protein
MRHKKCNTSVKFGTVQYTLECDFDDDQTQKEMKHFKYKYNKKFQHLFQI